MDFRRFAIVSLDPNVYPVYTRFRVWCLGFRAYYWLHKPPSRNKDHSSDPTSGLHRILAPAQ